MKYNQLLSRQLKVLVSLPLPLPLPLSLSLLNKYNNIYKCQCKKNYHSSSTCKIGDNKGNNKNHITK